MFIYAQPSSASVLPPLSGVKNWATCAKKIVDAKNEGHVDACCGSKGGNLRKSQHPGICTAAVEKSAQWARPVN